MISDDTINRLAKQYQTTELNIRREYLQHLFLASFYQQKHSQEVLFKGGTALRILYQSPRFSEDLDFSASPKPERFFQDLLLNTLVDVERSGAKSTIDEAKVTSGGYLAVLSFAGFGTSVSLQLQISHRPRTEKGKAQVTGVVSDFLPPYTVFHLSQEVLVSEKIQALFDRKKPRDFYDLYFLLRGGFMTLKHRSFLSKALAVLEHSKDLPFEKELKTFLPKSHWPLIRHFGEVLEQEIRRYTGKKSMTGT